MVLESNTLDVLFVKDGQQGEDGKVLYTWIKYAKAANGTGMTDDPDGAIYIGISYNNESSIESNDPTQYAWTKIQGADGKKGEDAYTIFLENENISFATDKNRNPLSEQAYTSGITIMKGAKPVTGFTIGDIAKTQGIAVAKTDTAIAISVVNGNPLPNDSGEIEIPITVGGTVFKKILTWTCAKKGDQGERGLQGIQGPQGEQGIAGKDGTSVTIINKSITYQLSTSGTVIPTGTWQTSPQTIPEGQYQWTKTSVTYSDGNQTESYSISYHGKNGSDGTSVKTTSTSVKYQVGDSGTTKPTGTWQSNVPTVAQGKYLWTQTIVNYSDGNSTESYSVSYRGIDGSNGVNGMNAATIYLYQRATSTPSKPSNTLTYTFSTTKITGTLNNGWSTAIPTGTDAVYVTVASVSSKNDTTTIATSAWSAPVVLAQNGKTGSDGKAGLNVATIYLYQRNTSKPSKPSASVTYTFSTGVASGLNNGWSQKIPDGTNPLYVTLATASSNTATDTILSSEWSDVVVMAQNGEDGQDGISPKVSLSKTGDTTTISIVDATGTHTQTVKDGTNGTPGEAGKDGKTSYFHVKYSNDGGKTFTGNSGEDAGIYMGSYTDYTEGDSTDVKKYNWVKVSGDNFSWNLLTKDDCNMSKWTNTMTSWIKVTNNEYNNIISYTTLSGGWEIIYKKISVEKGKKYVLSFDYKVNKAYLHITNDNKYGVYLSTTTPPNATPTDVIINGRYTIENTVTGIKRGSIAFTAPADTLYIVINGGCIQDGQAGLSFEFNKWKLEEGTIASPWTPHKDDLEGRGVAETVQYYLATSQASGVTSSTSGWSTDITTQKLTADKKYLWNCYQTKYSDGTSEPISTPKVIGVYGDKGQKGDNAKNLSITPSAQYFKSTDGGKTFAPNTITIKPTIQGEISFGKWQYSIDGGVSFADVVSGQKGLTISNNVLSISKDSSLYSDAVTMVTFRAVANDSSFYDTCSVAKIYDVSDIGDGRNLWITRDNITLQACEKDKYIYITTGTSAVCIGADAASVGTNTIALQTGTKYTISFVISSPSEVGNALWYFCTALNSTGVKNYGGYGVKLVTGENIVSQTITVDTSCDAAGLVLYHLPTGCVIKDIQVEKGSSPTGWTPAPEDIQTAILSTKSEISDVSLKVDKNKQAIEQRVEKTTYQQDLNLVKGDISKANEGLNKWRYEIYPKSLFASEYQGKSTMDVFAKNTNLTPSQSVLINDTDFGKSWAYGDNYIGYALTFVKFSAAKSIAITFKHDDGAHLYLNGKLIGGDDTCNTGSGESLTLSFIQGWNCLEVVLNEKSGGEYIGLGTTISAISECQLMNCYYGTPVARQSHITNQLVENTTNIDGVSGSVQKVMSTVGGSSKIDEFVNNYSTWKKKVDGIETRVGETYTTKDDFNGLEIGGRNLVRLGGLSGNGATSFSYDKTTDTYTIVSPVVSTVWGTGAAVKYDDNHKVLIPYGKTYILSFEVKVPQALSINIDINNYAVSGSSWAGNDNDDGSTRGQSSYSIPANTWTKVWVRWANTNTKNTNKVDLYDNSSIGLVTKDCTSAVTWQIRHVKGELGNKPTDWTPAPEDVNGKIVNVETIANQTAKKFEWIVKGGDSSSNFTLTDRVADLVAERINFKGLVTFSGTTNLIENSNMMNGLANITSECKAIKVIDDSTYRKALVITPIAGGRIFWGVANVWKANITYTVSFVAKSSVAGQKIKPSRSVADWGDEITLTTSYVKYTTRIKSTATADGGTLSFSFSNAIGDVTLTNVKLETGMNPTDWSPAPGDYITQASLVRNWTTNTTWINGGKIYTGSITADKIATDAIKSRNYISSGGTQGSFLNLSDGSFQSPNLSWDANGNLIAKNANLSGQITATKGKIGSFNLDKSLYLSNNSPYYFSQFCAKKVYGLTNEGDIYIGSEGIYSYSWETGNMYIGDSGSIQADVSSSRGVCIENGEIYIYKSDYCKDYPTACDNKYGLVLAGGYVASANYSDGGSIDGFNFILTPNKFNINGKIYASNELQTGGDQIRIISGNIGCMVRNDSADFYILRTNSGDPYGGWTNDRPFRINWASNDITCGHNLTANDLIANSWVYCSEVHSSGAVVIASNSESYYWAHGYQMARGTSWGGVCIGDDSQGLRLYGTSIWASHSISTSDENLKENFTTLDQYEDFYMNLNPIGFNYIGDYDGKKTHFGFGAHKTEDILESEGYDSDKFAVVTHRPLVQEDIEKRFGKDVTVDIETEYGVSYTEFIALNTHMIQKTRRELTKVKQEKADLEARLQAIEAKLGL